MADQLIPIFPLNTVLFPEGPLPLRIFEPRYLDMVSECLRAGTGFGVCLIVNGPEVGAAPDINEQGTLAHITDWHQRNDGLLGITATGIQRFRIISRRLRPNHLMEADVEFIDNEPPTELPAEYIPLTDLLRQLIKQIPDLFQGPTIRYGDAGWVSNRLAELLPMPLEEKQQLLQILDPMERLARLRQIMDRMNIQF